MRWDRLLMAVVLSGALSLLAVCCLIALGMGVGSAFGAGALCWLFGTVAALSGGGMRRWE